MSSYDVGAPPSDNDWDQFCEDHDQEAGEQVLKKILKDDDIVSEFLSMEQLPDSLGEEADTNLRKIITKLYSPASLSLGQYKDQLSELGHIFFTHIEQTIDYYIEDRKTEYLSDHYNTYPEE